MIHFEMSKLTGYRVDILMSLTQTYAPYTSQKTPIDLDMAKSLAAYLKRQKSAGRIVCVMNGEVLDEW